MSTDQPDDVSRAIDSRYFRDVLGRYPTGVTAVTAIDVDGEPVGMAVGSFASISLDPPLVGFFPAKSSSSFPKIRSAGSFCVNVLAADQEFVCRDFSIKGGDKFARVSWRTELTGAPVIDGALAWIDCTIKEVSDAGDHYLVIGTVGALGGESEGTPLVFFRGGYGEFAAPSLVARSQDDLLEQLRITEMVRSHLKSAADELALQAVAVGAAEDQLVILGSAGRARAGTPPARLGHRMPLMAPAGGLFVAWSSDSVIDTWLRRRGVVTEQDRKTLLAGLSAIRTRGWSLALSDDAHLELEDAIGKASTAGGDFDSGVRQKAVALVGQYDPAEIAADADHDVRLISAPIFDADGRVVLSFSLWGLPSSMNAVQVEQHARVLLDAAQEATRAIGGRPPSRDN